MTTSINKFHPRMLSFNEKVLLKHLISIFRNRNIEHVEIDIKKEVVQENLTNIINLIGFSHKQRINIDITNKNKWKLFVNDNVSKQQRLNDTNEYDSKFLGFKV